MNADRRRLNEITEEVIGCAFRVAGDVEDSPTAALHYFDTPIYVDAEDDYTHTATSDTLTVRVYELAIEYVRNHSPLKNDKVVVGLDADYQAIASSDCTSWEWIMPDGWPSDWWHPAPVSPATWDRSGTSSIPTSDLPDDSDWDEMGDENGHIYVTCEDGDDNSHSSDYKLLEVFFRKDGIGNPDGTDPNWFYYWKEFVAWGLIEDLDYNAGLGAYGDTDVENASCIVGPLAGGFNDETGHRGIHTFYETLAHESEHIAIWQEMWPNGYIAAQDSEPDAYNDTWEVAHAANGFVVGVDDTYNAGPPPSVGHTYEETRCRAVEHAVNETIYDSKDWSFDPARVNQGKQW